MIIKDGMKFETAALQQKASPISTAAPVSQPLKVSDITSAGRMRYASHIAATFNVGIENLGLG
jgi:hypothetical protein